MYLGTTNTKEVKNSMPRNTVQKTKTQTIAHGFIVEDDAPKPVSFMLDGKYTINTAQKLIRREQPSFSISNCTYTETLYTMTFDEFFQLATPHETKEC